MYVSICEINMFKPTIYLIETPFSTFANKAEPDQAAFVRAAWSGPTLFAYGNMIRYDHTQVDLTSNLFYVQQRKFIYRIIHSGWSFAWKFTKNRLFMGHELL